MADPAPQEVPVWTSMEQQGLGSWLYQGSARPTRCAQGEMWSMLFWSGRMSQDEGSGFAQQSIGFTSSCEEILGEVGEVCLNRLFDDFKYPTEWTSSMKDYLLHKDKILNTICDYMDNYDSYRIKMQHQRQSLMNNFFHGKNLYSSINESIIKL